jgi:hypothetical protein
MKTVSMQAVASAIERKFHIQLDIYDIIETTAEVLKKMGMIALSKSTDMYLVQNFCVKLPPTVSSIKSVTQMDPYNYPTDIVIQDIYHPPSLTLERSNEVLGIEDTVENNGEVVDGGVMDNYLGQTKGVYTDFVWDCPYVKLNYTDYWIAVEYVKLSEDENGLPVIPEEALNACVYYNVYTYMEPVYLTGKVPDYVFARLEKWKDKHINQAKNDMMFGRLSANEQDKIFDIFASFDRKRTNIDS